MQQPSARTCLLLSGGIASAVIGADLARLAKAGRAAPGWFRETALAAATLLAAVGLSTRHTQLTLDLARRIERARSAAATGPATIRRPASHTLLASTGHAVPDGRPAPVRSR